MEPTPLINGLPISEWFQYHPPTTEKRRAIHAAINGAALAFAETVVQYVDDPTCKEMAVFAIQQARMFANQGATVDELRSGYETLNE